MKVQDLAGTGYDLRFSPNCWRIKMVLEHKGPRRIGASHQTGWTALVAKLIQQYHGSGRAADRS